MFLRKLPPRECLESKSITLSYWFPVWSLDSGEDLKALSGGLPGIQYLHRNTKVLFASFTVLSHVYCGVCRKCDDAIGNTLLRECVLLYSWVFQNFIRYQVGLGSKYMHFYINSVCFQYLHCVLVSCLPPALVQKQICKNPAVLY